MWMAHFAGIADESHIVFFGETSDEAKQAGFDAAYFTCIGLYEIKLVAGEQKLPEWMVWPVHLR